MKKIIHLLTLVMIGYFSNAQSFGSLDNTFNNGSGTDDIVEAIAIQSDGKILVAGGFSSYNGNATGQVIRLNTDGTHDNTFITSVTGQVKCLAIQNDGKILIGGGFSQVNGTQAMRVARLNSDGSLDNTFNTGTGVFGGSIQSLAVMFDGSIVATGSITTFNDVSVSNLIKLNSNGSFVVGSYGTNNLGSISDMVVQPNGKILICGQFTQYNGVTRNRIARLNADLSLDTSFDPGTLPIYSIYSIALQDDGKIVLLGGFSPFINRLNSDGSLDDTFDAGTGLNDDAYEITITNNNKIVIGGYFNSFNGTPINRLVVLNSDGSMDNSFNSGTGPNDVVNVILTQNDGKILIGGNFTSYNGTSRTGITRLNGESTSNLNEIDAQLGISIYPNPSSTLINVEMENASTVRLFDVSGKLLKEMNGASIYTIDVTDLTPGMYMIESAEGAKAKFIKQ
jgi:uncharacterized delta-60 repeat protein